MNIEQKYRELIKHHEEHHDELDALRSENERMREALMKSDPWDVDMETNKFTCCHCGEEYDAYGMKLYPPDNHKSDCIWALVWKRGDKKG